MHRAACIAKLTKLADVKGSILKPSQEDLDYVSHAHTTIIMLQVQVFASNTLPSITLCKPHAIPSCVLLPSAPSCKVQRHGTVRYMLSRFFSVITNSCAINSVLSNTVRLFQGCTQAFAGIHMCAYMLAVIRHSCFGHYVTYMCNTVAAYCCVTGSPPLRI